MEGHCSTGQSPQWAVVPMEEEEIMACLCLHCISCQIYPENTASFIGLLKVIPEKLSDLHFQIFISS